MGSQQERRYSGILKVPGITEFTFDYFVKTSGLSLQKVPYRDIVQAATDVGEGRLQIYMASYAILQPQAQAGRIVVLAQMGRIDEAEALYHRALEARPDYPDAHYNLAGALGSQGKLDEAIGHLRRALDINPRRADAHHNLGVALGSQGKFDEALDHVREALKTRPDAEAQGDLMLLKELTEKRDTRSR